MTVNNPSTTRFAFFGTPYVARDTLAALCGAGFVPAVVVTSPAAPKGRGLVVQPSATEMYAREQGIVVLTPAALDERFIAEMAAYECDYAVVVAYGKMLPSALLELFSSGVVNVHYSLLPLYRGASPVETALRNGDRATGVTIQRMVLAMDAGDILAQREETIFENDTTITLRPRLIALGAQLLVEVLPALIAGTAVGVPQDHAQATRASKILKSEGELTITSNSPEDALSLHRNNWLTYRALCESPGTYFYASQGDKRMRVKITQASFTDGIFVIERIVPEGKSEQPYSWLAATGWQAQ